MATNITMYGTTWCGDCMRSKAFLEEKGINYDFINIDEDESAAEKVIKINNGNRSVPTIVFSDNSSLTEPSNGELEEKLKALNVLD